MKNKVKIKQASKNAHRETFKVRPSVKYLALYGALLTKFKAAREKGFCVNFGWLWSKARKIYKEQQGEDAIVRKHVITTFIKRYNLRMRAKQRNRKQPKESFREGLSKWHGTTRERLVRSGKDDTYDQKWGRFLPSQRFNVDQSPLPFAITTKRTYELVKKGDQYHKVWISQPGSGLEKRQCTLQVCFRPTGKQPKLAIIFRGKGKRITKEEKAAWHKDVDVYFQENAWADTDFSVAWAQKTLKTQVESEKRFALFCDNLTAQISDEFKSEISSQSGVCWFGLPNATDLWQPVDAGYAELLKTFVGQAQHEWLDNEDNAEKWYGNESGFSAKDRRILITLWAGSAYQKLISKDYDDFRWRLFEKTGCLITADGSQDDKISPEGLPEYKPPPPLDYIEPSTAAPVSNTVEPPTVDPEVYEVADNEEEENEAENESLHSEELIDDAKDRCYNDELVGRSVKALYENGWFTGKIKYFNQKICRYLVLYKDKSTDLIDISCIDGVEMILIDKKH